MHGLETTDHVPLLFIIIYLQTSAAVPRMLRRTAANILLFSSVACYLPCIVYTFSGAALSYRLKNFLAFAKV